MTGLSPLQAQPVKARALLMRAANMRPLSARAFALAFALLPALALAQTPAASPAATPEERPSPDWFTESTIFSTAPSIPGHTPFWERGTGNTPIVGTDASGNFVDVRDGRTLTAEEAAAAVEASDLGGSGIGVTVLHAETSGIKGLTKGKFKDGSLELKKGTLGKATLDAGSAWGYATAGAAVGADGVRGGGSTGGTLTVIGLSATTKTAGFGKKDSTVKGAAEGLGYAMVGADGSAGALARIGADALAVGAKAGAFIGASAGLSAIGELSVAGVAVRILAGASAGYGLGSDVAAFFKLDWTNMAVRIGGRALAALGPAAGLSLDVEISLAGLMKKLGVDDAISKGVKKVAGIVKSAASRVARGLGLMSGTPQTGADASRDASTTAAAPSHGPPPTAAAAKGAGMARD